MKTFIMLLFTWLIAITYGQTDTIETVHKIGDHFGGGIIFYLDETGQQGLVAAPSVQVTDAKWSKLTVVTKAKFLNDGFENTKFVLESMREYPTNPKNTGVFVCDTLTLEGFSDWYLPSVQELKKMYTSQKYIGNVLVGYYWSSTEYNGNKAWAIAFGPSKHLERPLSKINKKLNVRCIRQL